MFCWLLINFCKEHNYISVNLSIVFVDDLEISAEELKYKETNNSWNVLKINCIQCFSNLMLLLETQIFKNFKDLKTFFKKKKKNGCIIKQGRS